MIAEFILKAIFKMYNKSKDKISSKQITLLKPAAKIPSKQPPKQRENILPSINSNGSKKSIDRVTTGVKPDRSSEKLRNIVPKK